ncbi:MAG: SPOR domain-containing protein [Tagaea sp.]|nr:SPOR domain-containing protein [Tagaea sp.]
MIRRAILAAALFASPVWAQSLDEGVRALAQSRFGEAVRHLGPLAQQGNADAQYLVGTMYANGDGLPVDQPRAERLFRAAAAQGHARAREQVEFMRALRAPAQSASAAPAPVPAAVPLPDGDGGWRVQLGTVANAEVAQSEHRRLARRFPEILGESQAFVAPFTMPDGAQVVRVMAGPYDETRARDVCAKLRDLNTGCRVVRPES